MSEIKVIAIVDDEVDMLEVMQLFFEDVMDLAKYKFQYFSSGIDCLKYIENIDYLVSDINMPGMDGYQLVSEAKKLSPNIKVSLMSAYSGDEYKQKAMAVGIEEYFVKPLDIDLIKKRLEKSFGS